ncbi:uncharacterized protein EDB91DRAFT_1113353 [Suillus paluster]|uniref:uncharacterized protein n=1 Tax=Suillus paluster TaxID=48578 RepID=UPI001B8645B9|nr:uncharacterized protein EDB91DRAFT_1113353 [Suillus paluster]KAG1748322.1 hypothetical protein EDB91DRAFT_1113353 [Suillus paluster]
MPKQKKSVLQKKYRNKELDGFSLVRTEIYHATRGEVDPRTRQDVLKKAARLIRELYVLNAELQYQLCKSRPGSDKPPSCVGGLQTPISRCTEDLHSPILYDCFIEPNGVAFQVADVTPPTELQSFVTSTGYELCDTNMSLGNIGHWSLDHQLKSPSTASCYCPPYNQLIILR